MFEFDTGITAVIGPNGSGKSNIADAMRWVLGEQSYSNLRGRKAEDVIFSGSTARAPVGMAEVTLTLDNSSGHLPIDFQEVSITRRAHRSGENQYLINGARVRLKDVNQITASLGQSHTVIGQGLVDAALSQRPEERRSLFEHAAGITGLRLKHATTARHLGEAETNSTRLEDLLNELEPRLRTLERQAKQAREYVDIQRALRETALRYYAALWHEHQEKLKSLETTAHESDELLEQVSLDLENCEASIQELRDQLVELRNRSRSLAEQKTASITTLRELEHRIEMITQRQSTFRDEITRIEQSTTELRTDADEIFSQMAARSEERARVHEQLTALGTTLRKLEAEHDAYAEQRERLSARQDQLDAERSELHQSLYRAQAEREYRVRQLDDLQERLKNLEAQRQQVEAEQADLRGNVDQHATQQATLQQALSGRREHVARLESESEAKQQSVHQLREELEALASQRTRISARLEALQRLQESGEGLHRGVQAVLEAATSRRLQGIVGTLASQLTVPAELEHAIEAALGGRLQDIVVRHWADTEAAIGYLKQNNAGRATFQPLDTIRSSGDGHRPALQNEAGVHGIAADLVGYDQELAPVVQGLLARVLVTDDLRTTRRVLAKLRSGWTIVTLDGDVSRSGGSVTGGSRVRQSGTLGRERELRELPVELEQLDRHRGNVQRCIQAAKGEHADTLTALREARNTLRTSESELDRARRQHESLMDRMAATDRQLARLDQERDSTADDIKSRTEEIDRLDTQIRAIDEALASNDAKRSELIDELERLQATSDEDELRRLEVEISGLRERERSLTREIDELRDRRDRARPEIERLDQLRVSTDESISRNEQELSRLQSEVDSERANVEALTRKMDPLDGEESTLQKRIDDRQHGIHELRERHRDLERARDRQRFEVQRQEAQGDLILERAADVLEVENPKSLLAQQPREENLDLRSLENQLHHLRQRSRRIGAFGEETITQFEQEQERFTFLRGQLDDVQRGAESLREMLVELERSMALEFDRTFGQVAQAFEVTFQQLFGGGHAKLVRTDDEDSVGIDIVAQPPGKRLQSLALLSGGERALTAVALLFAILRVNPSPFCLLDEVDAALDEANVVRFREELRDLARNTQFIVVTHNRSTIEGADVLYGITMGSDAVSRVVSLKLPPEPIPTSS